VSLSPPPKSPTYTTHTTDLKPHRSRTDPLSITATTATNHRRRCMLPQGHGGTVASIAARLRAGLLVTAGAASAK